MVEQVDASEGAIKVGSAPTIDRSSEVLAAVASPEENSGVPGEVLVSDTANRSDTDAQLDSISIAELESIERIAGLNASAVTTIYRIPENSYKYGFKNRVKVADQPDLFTKKALFGKSSSNVKRISCLASLLIPIVSFTGCVLKYAWGFENNFKGDSINAYPARANPMTTSSQTGLYKPVLFPYFQQKRYYTSTTSSRFDINSRYHPRLFSTMDELGHGDLILETDRLILRKPCEYDATSIFEYASSENVSRYTSWENHKNIEDSKFFVERSLALFGRGYRVGPFIILKKDDPDKAIRTISCFNVSYTDKCMEVALAICEKHWGTGIATEASKEVINSAFSRFYLERLQFRCATENKASLALALRLGFQYEGVLRHSIWNKGRYWDVTHLSMLRADWEKNNTSSSFFPEKKL
jgi:ribosomal-protein-alanine N-acetyltransferase